MSPAANLGSVFPSYDAAYSAIIDTSVPAETLAYAAASTGSFLIDSGCQRHMTCIRSIFTHIEEFHPPILIRGIGDTGIEANARGTIAIPVTIDGALSWFYLSDVLYAPELHRNLISTGALLESGLHVSLDTSGAVIYNNASRLNILATAAFKDRLWILRMEDSVATVQMAPEANVATTGVDWHRRFGHIGMNALRNLASTGAIDKLTKSDLTAIENCEVCVLAKGARLPFPVSTSVSSSAPLELVHSDLCGPFDASVGGARYTASFVDDFTRVAWVFLPKTKDELAKVFIRLRAHVELFTGLKVKTLCSDGGGEYISHVLGNHLADAGILHQMSCPNSSQQNGVAERFQRTLFDRVRSLLQESGMSWGWWGEAAVTATYLYNRIPHSALPGHVSPLSYWSNKSISITHIRVFGSKCFAIDTDKNRKKSAPRAVECRLLGYDVPSKAYRLQVKGSTKIIRSRDVVFHTTLERSGEDSSIYGRGSKGQGKKRRTDPGLYTQRHSHPTTGAPPLKGEPVALDWATSTTCHNGKHQT
ncbi:Pol polyprotein/retrotransposon [Ceratobasidium sp. AG-Ba]|nr:Pol polyprotein/retrotransposon [Ceratobasidium sp. AG-Ba]